MTTWVRPYNVLSTGSGTSPLWLSLLQPLLKAHAGDLGGRFKDAWNQVQPAKNFPSGGKGSTKSPLSARWDMIHPLRKREPPFFSTSKSFVLTWGTKRNKVQNDQAPTQILGIHSLNEFIQETDFKAAWHSICLHRRHRCDYYYCYYYHNGFILPLLLPLI